MSPERTRIARCKRKNYRTSKNVLSKEIGLTLCAQEPDPWNKTEEILIAKLGNEYTQKYSPHAIILKEFFELRVAIKENNQLSGIKEFQNKYKPELLRELKSAFMIITEVVGK